MSDKKKMIAIGVVVLVAGGIVANLVFTPKTSKLQSASNTPQESLVVEVIEPVTPVIAPSALTVSTNIASVEVVAAPSPAPDLYLKPLNVDVEVTELINGVHERAVAEVKANTSEFKSREWDAGQSQRESQLGQSIGVDFASTPAVTTSTVDGAVVQDVTPMLTLRGITGTANEGIFAARLFTQGQFKRVMVGSKLSGYTVTRITRDSVTLKGQQGARTLTLGESL